MGRFGYLAVLSFGMAIGGCADLTHFNRQTSMPMNGRAARVTYIDAKQRAVFQIPSTEYVGREVHRVVNICAEPSPDALSALAASAGGSLSKKDAVDLAAKFGIAESAGSIGLRTQSIQLLRDAMYRICEASASGKYSPAQIETMQRRLHSAMIAILAIEQLTGAVRGPAVALGGTAQASNAELVAKLTDKVASGRSGVEAAQADQSAKEAAAATAKAKPSELLKSKGKDKPEDLAAADKTEYDKLVADGQAKQKAADDAGQTLANRKADLANYQAALSAAQAGDVSVSSTGSVVTVPGANLSGDSVTAVAAAVEHIVKQTLDLGYLRETCTTIFLADLDGRARVDYSKGIAQQCVEYAKKSVQAPDQPPLFSTTSSSDDNLPSQSTDFQNIESQFLSAPFQRANPREVRKKGRH